MLFNDIVINYRQKFNKLRVNLLLSLLLLTYCLFFISYSNASSLDVVKQFVLKTQSAECEFTQTVFNKSNQMIQKSYGIFKISRPNKFYWEFIKPNSQIIINDSKKIWIYDPELKQVTSKPVEKMLSQTPASLLAGNNNIEDYFTLKVIKKQDNAILIEAIPKKNKDAQFEKIQLSFQNSLLHTIELYDYFGQRTFIEFNHFKLNIKFNPQQFRYTVPKGIDLIEE